MVYTIASLLPKTNSMKPRLSFALLLFSIAQLAIAQKTLPQAKLAHLNQIASRDVPPGGPGIATAIVQNGRVVFEGYYGLETLTDSTSIDAKSRFNIASNGKQFTALSVAILIEQNRLALADRVAQYLPEFADSPIGRLSIQQLVTHTSGIRDIYDLWSFQGITWWKHPFTNSQALQLLRQQTELNANPGAAYRYSNSNYILLSQIVAAASGQSFRAFTDTIFAELGMPATHFESDYEEISDPVARPYFNFGRWVSFNWRWDVVGDGNLFTTLPDQITWEKLVQNPPTDHKFYRAILASQKLIAGGPVNYGYGLEFGAYRGKAYRFHEGATGAWKATFARFPADSVAFITFTNSGKTIPEYQTREMIDAYFELSEEAPVIITRPTEVGPYLAVTDILGLYLTPENYPFEFLLDESGTLQLYRSDRGHTELERDTNNIFRQKYDPDFKQEFKRLPNGDLTVTAYHPSHQPYTLTKKKADFSNFDYQAVAGTYLSRETGVALKITYVGKSAYQVVRGERKPVIAKMVSPTKMIFGNYVATINSPNEISLDFERVRNLRLVRVD